MTLFSAARRNAPKANQIKPTSDQVQFLLFLYGQQEGWVELCFINGDPKHEGLERDCWYHYTPAKAKELARRCAELAARYGNVYVSSGLYRERHRRAAYALPCRILFADDAPEIAEPTYSAVVRTSENSRHAYYLLDKPVSPERRKALQQRLALHLGSDKSGADVEQVVRIPDSFNTKQHGRFPVVLEALSGQVYTTDELAALYPSQALSDAPYKGSLDWAKVEHWLGNIELLLGRDGLPRRFKNPNVPARRMLKTDKWRDTSSARATLAKSLVLHGYPDEEIAALLVHFDFGAIQRKGSDWLYADIERLICKYRSENLSIRVNPTGRKPVNEAKPLPKAARASRARKDRPQKYNADSYLQWLIENQAGNGVVMRGRRETWEALSISESTLDRLERELKKRGAIERTTLGDSSYVRILEAVFGGVNIPQSIVDRTDVDATKNSAQQIAVDSISMQRNDVDATPANNDLISKHDDATLQVLRERVNGGSAKYMEEHTPIEGISQAERNQRHRSVTTGGVFLPLCAPCR